MSYNFTFLLLIKMKVNKLCYLPTVHLNVPKKFVEMSLLQYFVRNIMFLL